MAHDLAQNHPPSPEALAQGYEPAAAPIRGLALFVAGLFVSLGLVWWLNWSFMEKMIHRERVADLPRSAVADLQATPTPRLQPSPGHDALPYQDMDAMRENEDSVFAKLGWTVDSKTHEVSIPAAVLQKLQQRNASGQTPATLPTATPRGVNTILPGPPATQNTHGTDGSPQGPTPNERLDPSDQPDTLKSGGLGHGPQPERQRP